MSPNLAKKTDMINSSDSPQERSNLHAIQPARCTQSSSARTTRKSGLEPVLEKYSLTTADRRFCNPGKQREQDPVLLAIAKGVPSVGATVNAPYRTISHLWMTGGPLPSPTDAKRSRRRSSAAPTQLYDFAARLISFKRFWAWASRAGCMRSVRIASAIRNSASLGMRRLRRKMLSGAAASFLRSPVNASAVLVPEGFRRAPLIVAPNWRCDCSGGAGNSC